ncbi:lamin tail domain-containing protein [Neolewinella antarctica]|uniref:LTD domain-containing protein n=1 Tax=Neolewinella antarctica TaxID=442734 RepID=A0ABX0XGH4_9BACT|nr:lamin tail domain-containing protein [Neolewinella antarctica]NJC28433.1 hypothetical protein [Neolewinella antarctica]
MDKIYSLRVVLALLFTLSLCTGVRAQSDTIAFQGFESSPSNDWAFTTDPATYSNTNSHWGGRTTSRSITPFAGTMLFGGRDLNNTAGGRPGDNFLNFDAVDVSGANDVLVSFYYNVFGFDGGDDFKYTLTIDGAAQPEVLLIDGINTGGVSSAGWERIELIIPDSSVSVQLSIAVVQNGGNDYFAVDNFEVVSNTCGITVFGPAEVVCIDETPATGTDNFRISIPYVGMSANATIVVRAGATTPANDVTATTTNVGEDPNTVANGTIVLENFAGEFEEGDEIRVTLSDPSGDCNYVLDVSTTENQCRNPCNPNINVNNIYFNCDAQTAANDGGTAIARFTGGPEPGVVVTVDGGATVSGADPATDRNGNIILSGLVEGNAYTVTFTGGGCVDGQVKTRTFNFASGACAPSELIINEILADPPTNVDVNGNGESSTSRDEFVEIYNGGDTPIDAAGYTVYNQFSRRFTFPAGTIIPAKTAVVVFGSAPNNNSFGCSVYGGSSLNLNNTMGEVTVRNALRGDATRVSYSGGASDQSFARSPDFTGPLVQHQNITTNSVPFSPCESNTTAGLVLPIELLQFGAAAGAKQVELSWATGNERDNDRFFVDRSSDSQDWTELGSVNAGLETANTYTFTDTEPAAGTNYYRLRQYDLDGTMTEYGPVATNFARGDFAVYPNPVAGRLNFNQSLNVDEVAIITDINGRVLRQLPDGVDGVEVSDLTAGVYLLRVQRKAGAATIRFIKR